MPLLGPDLPPPAQLSPVTGLAAEVARLPSGSGLDRYVFEQPWPLMLVLVVAGTGIAIALRRRGKPRHAGAALLLALLLAAANFLAASVVTTPGERCMRLTRAAIRHVLAPDAAALSPLLRADLVVRPFSLSKDAVLSAVATHMAGDYAVQSSSILSLRAVQDSADAVRTQVHLRATPRSALYNVPTGSWWILTWQRDPVGESPWVVTQIECQHIDGVSNPASVRP